MNAYVIDTNVIAAANGKADHLMEKDVQVCKNFIKSCYKKYRISIDSSGLIFEEYFRYTNRSGQPEIGDVLVKWLWDNCPNPESEYCEQVDITPIDKEKTDFREFPQSPSLVKFDKSDRKFVAVALASKYQPEICNACDNDWREFEEALKMEGVRLKFLL